MTYDTSPSAAVAETGKPWLPYEIDLIVAAYFEMFSRHLRGERFRKVDVVRGLESAMPARNRRAIEAKFQNISAILDELGLGWLEGYKPLHNVQQALRVAVSAWVSRGSMVRESMEAYQSSTLVAPRPVRQATEDVLVPAPGAAERHGARRTSVGLVGGTNAALDDFRRKQLGDAGERWVFELERESLRRLGRDDLAHKVSWAAKDIGDGLGYDVVSYRVDGRQHIIEVKTTNLGSRTPFFITRHEVEVSRDRAEDYSLYRVHGFARDPRIYVLPGNIEERARLEPSVFLGIPI